MIPQLQPHEVNLWLATGQPLLLLDVRQPEEHAYCALAGSVLIPLDELPQRLDEVEHRRPEGALVVVYCHHGIRSLRGAAILRAAGIDAVSLAGGIDRWALTVDPTMPRY